MSQTQPPGWTCAALADVAQINPHVNCAGVADEERVNFVPMRAVDPNGGGLARPELSTYGRTKKGYTSFLSGDVIMAKITPCMENGKTAIAPRLPIPLFFGSTEFHVLRPETGVLAAWIAYFILQSNFRNAARRQMAGGVGQLRVPESFLEKASIPVAPVAEQQRIIALVDELLSDLDAGVEALERVQKKLAHYRAAVLKAAVGGALTAGWRKQHPDTEPASVLLDRILAERRLRWEEEQFSKFIKNGKEPPKNWKTRYKEPIQPGRVGLPGVHKGWSWATVEQLGDVGTGATPNRGMKARYYDGGTVPWVTSTCVNSPFVSEPSEYVAVRALEECNLTLYPPGTLLLAMYGEGKTRGMCTELLIESTTNQALAAIQTHSKLTRFLKLLLANNYQDLRRAASGGVQPNLNLASVRQIAVPLPPLAEQELIVESTEDQISVIDHLEKDIDIKLRAARTLRHAILRHAFTGQLVPQDPNDEPAIELLKRIAAEREARTRQVVAAKNSRKRAAKAI